MRAKLFQHIDLNAFSWCEQEINHHYFWHLIYFLKHSIIDHFIMYLLLFGPELFAHQICQVSLTFGGW